MVVALSRALGSIFSVEITVPHGRRIQSVPDRSSVPHEFAGVSPAPAGVIHARRMPAQRLHHADANDLDRAAVIGHPDLNVHGCLPFLGVVVGFRQAGDVGASVPQRGELGTIRQHYGFGTRRRKSRPLEVASFQGSGILPACGDVSTRRRNLPSMWSSRLRKYWRSVNQIPVGWVAFDKKPQFSYRVCAICSGRVLLRCA